MHTIPFNLESLAERIEKLERQNRWVKRTGVALVFLPMLIALMGQGKPVAPKPTPNHQGTVPSMTDFQNVVIENLSGQIDDLQARVTKLETETNAVGRYQIAATSYSIADVQFAKVFIVDTRTGAVCQVVGDNPMNGETPGTTLPFCTQDQMTITLQGNTYTKSAVSREKSTPSPAQYPLPNQNCTGTITAAGCVPKWQPGATH